MELTALQIATRRHREADMLLSGTYGRMNGGFHGCSVGCLAFEIAPEKFQGGDWTDWTEEPHELVAGHFGYPEWLVRLQDALFEGLPEPDRKDWHVQIADAIAARGRDWQTILHAVHAGILRISYRTAGSAEVAVQAVLDLHERAVRGEAVASDEWSAARSAARSAAWAAESAARSAESAAELAARSAARSAAWAAESAARSAARSAAWAAAESAAWAAAESAAWSAARSAESAESAAARSAAWAAAYREIRDVVLAEIVRAA